MIPAWNNLEPGALCLAAGVNMVTTTVRLCYSLTKGADVPGMREWVTLDDGWIVTPEVEMQCVDQHDCVIQVASPFVCSKYLTRIDGLDAFQEHHERTGKPYEKKSS